MIAVIFKNAPADLSQISSSCVVLPQLIRHFLTAKQSPLWHFSVLKPGPVPYAKMWTIYKTKNLPPSGRGRFFFNGIKLFHIGAFAAPTDESLIAKQLKEQLMN
jgi:hypothetical protein